jgi:hypothetical protein
VHRTHGPFGGPGRARFPASALQSSQLEQAPSLYLHVQWTEDPKETSFGYLEFTLSVNRRVLIRPDWRWRRPEVTNVPKAIHFDEITESLAEEIASEVMIEFLHSISRQKPCEQEDEEKDED